MPVDILLTKVLLISFWRPVQHGYYESFPSVSPSAQQIRGYSMGWVQGQSASSAGC